MTDKRTVLLAFSGGMDSCYAARLLCDEGWAVTALTMDMTGDTVFIENARQKAKELNIPLIVENVRDIFRREVEDYFLSEYLGGRTPAPCTVCNYHVKWKILYEKALELGIGRIATGHYFNISENNGYFYVTKGDDPAKDQSYYLWMLPQEILSKALTPMGGIIKKEIKNKLPGNEASKESMGVCFLNGKPYKDYILNRISSLTHLPASVTPGLTADSEGNITGRHEGAAFYTIGQKKGLCTPSGLPVTGIDAPNNKIITGESSSLWKRRLIITDCRITNPEGLGTGQNITVKIRGFGKNPEGGCRIEYEGQMESMEIFLENPAWAPAPGQPVVLYTGNMVIGGGFLHKAY